MDPPSKCRYFNHLNLGTSSWLLQITRGMGQKRSKPQEIIWNDWVITIHRKNMNFGTFFVSQGWNPVDPSVAGMVHPFHPFPVIWGMVYTWFYHMYVCIYIYICLIHFNTIYVYIYICYYCYLLWLLLCLLLSLVLFLFLIITLFWILLLLVYRYY